MGEKAESGSVPERREYNFWQRKESQPMEMVGLVEAPCDIQYDYREASMKLTKKVKLGEQHLEHDKHQLVGVC